MSVAPRWFDDDGPFNSNPLLVYHCETIDEEPKNGDKENQSVYQSGQQPPVEKAFAPSLAIDSDISRIDAAFDGQTITDREDFNGEMRHRFEQKNLKDATLWKTDAHMSHDTTSHLAFAGLQGERAIPTPRKTLEGDWCPSGKFDARTVSGETYTDPDGVGIAETKIPDDSDLFQGDGIFDGETQNMDNFTDPGICEPCETIRPGESDMWKTDAHMSHDTTSHLAFAGLQGERAIPTPRKTSEEGWWPSGKFDGRTVSGETYTDPSKGIGGFVERKKPYDSDF